MRSRFAVIALVIVRHGGQRIERNAAKKLAAIQIARHGPA